MASHRLHLSLCLQPTNLSIVTSKSDTAEHDSPNLCRGCHKTCAIDTKQQPSSVIGGTKKLTSGESVPISRKLTTTVRRTITVLESALRHLNIRRRVLFKLGTACSQQNTPIVFPILSPMTRLVQLPHFPSVYTLEETCTATPPSPSAIT